MLPQALPEDALQAADASLVEGHEHGRALPAQPAPSWPPWGRAYPSPAGQRVPSAQSLESEPREEVLQPSRVLKPRLGRGGLVNLMCEFHWAAQ